MRKIQITLLIMASVVLVIAFGSKTYAFHQGGVAECVGCHSLHDAQSGALLIGNDISSTCLGCHEGSPGSYHISTPEASMGAGIPPTQMTPGGDFAWLKKSYTWNPGWAPQSEDGERHGHNIIAADFNYVADVEHATSPGGTFNAAQLACNSCHDNHGQFRRLDTGIIAKTGAPIVASGSYNNSPDPSPGKAVGVYRLLRGIGSTVPGGATFTVDPPSAVVPSSYNRTEATTDTRAAYGKGMSLWCATCHQDMHGDTNSGKLVHPVDQQLGTAVAGNYNAYVGSGDLGGNSLTSFDSIIPFQIDNSTDYAVLKAKAVNNGSDTNGPVTTDRVMCLSCHRAHASGWVHATRWNNEIELIILEGVWPGTDSADPEASQPKWAQGRTQAETARAYNDTPATDYGLYQRSLCNKCHAKD